MRTLAIAALVAGCTGGPLTPTNGPHACAWNFTLPLLVGFTDETNVDAAPWDWCGRPVPTDPIMEVRGPDGLHLAAWLFTDHTPAEAMKMELPTERGGLVYRAPGETCANWRGAVAFSFTETEWKTEIDATCEESGLALVGTVRGHVDRRAH
jgi:hypothetical protein